LLKPGAVIGGFRVERLLGQGGMGAVWRVSELATGEVYALKVIAAQGKQPRERIEREAAVQLQIRHPNVVAVYRYLTLSGQAALLMELVDGLPLDRLLQREPPDARGAVSLFVQICAGVAAAHEAGVVHRDLKPANVLVGNLGGPRIAKVTDFGLVRVMADVGPHRVTLSSATLGTPGYMAPEQASSARDADERSDVFSLGCILYRMLCGRPPFEGDLRASYQDLVRGVYPPPETFHPGLDGRVRDTIAACLRADPAERPPTPAAVCALLGRPPAGAPTRPPPAPEPITLQDLAPPPPPPVRSATPRAPEEAAPQPASTPPARRASGVAPWVAALALAAVVGAGGLALDFILFWTGLSF
jgi:serine/threonine-protein kinase